jgi:23S rRNA (uridine2552-2'-O)-methyltransferase
MGNRAYKRHDHLYHAAKEDGWRARSSYKLLEIQKNYKIIKPKSRILDLGAAPGGWMQACLSLLQDDGLVVGIDLEKIEPLNDPRAICIQGDIRELEDAMGSLSAKLVGSSTGNSVESFKFDVVLSDMSPKLSGIKEVDGHRCLELAEMALHAAQHFLVNGGGFVVKLFKNQDSSRFFKTTSARFSQARRVELDSTRNSSNEFYMVGKGFRK